MTSEKLTQLTQEELTQEAKKQKNQVYIFRFMMVLLMGAAVWNATHKGSFLISCLPLFFMSIFILMEKNYKAVQTEIILSTHLQARKAR